MGATATGMFGWDTERWSKRQRLASALALQEEMAIVSPAQRWWPLAVTGLGLTLLMPATAPVVGTVGGLLTLSTAWPLLQESGDALQEQRFAVAMLSAGVVVGGLITNHTIMAGVVSSVHHLWQAIHERQALAEMCADGTTQEIYVVRCWCMRVTAAGEPILRYVVETNEGAQREGFTDMDELRRSLLERLDGMGAALFEENDTQTGSQSCLTCVTDSGTDG